MLAGVYGMTALTTAQPVENVKLIVPGALWLIVGTLFIGWGFEYRRTVSAEHEFEDTAVVLPV